MKFCRVNISVPRKNAPNIHFVIVDEPYATLENKRIPEDDRRRFVQPDPVIKGIEEILSVPAALDRHVVAADGIEERPYLGLGDFRNDSIDAGLEDIDYCLYAAFQVERRLITLNLIADVPDGIGRAFAIVVIAVDVPLKLSFLLPEISVKLEESFLTSCSSRSVQSLTLESIYHRLILVIPWPERFFGNRALSGQGYLPSPGRIDSDFHVMRERIEKLLNQFLVEFPRFDELSRTVYVLGFGGLSNCFPSYAPFLENRHSAKIEYVHAYCIVVQLYGIVFHDRP